MSNTTKSATTTANLQSMDMEAFIEAYKNSRGQAGGSVPSLGSKWIQVATGIQLTVVRVNPKAKSCCFFQDQAGKIYYHNFLATKGQVKPVPATTETK